MKKQVFLFLILNFLYAVPVNAAQLQPQQKVISIIDTFSQNEMPSRKITDAIRNGFFTINGKTRYYKNGDLHTGFLNLDGKKYYFDSTGNMVTGSLKIKNASYYFDSKGVMKTGFVKIGSKRYYYDKKTGKMLYGSHKIGKNQYYFMENTGQMATGFVTRKVNGSNIKAYYNEQGHLKTGTFQVGSVEYKATAKTGKIYSIKNLAAAICQRPELPTGCEITSWTMMANYAEIKMNKIRAANMMPKSSDPNQGFVGSPYSSSGDSLVIYPEGLKSLTQQYFGSYINMTGCSLKKIQAKLQNQHLVLVWVTRLDGFNSHTVALTGYDQDSLFYNDPWTGEEGKISKEEFLTIWSENACRAMSY